MYIKSSTIITWLFYSSVPDSSPRQQPLINHLPNGRSKPIFRKDIANSLPYSVLDAVNIFVASDFRLAQGVC